MEVTALATQDIQIVEKRFSDIAALATDLEGEIQTQEQHELCLMVIQQSKQIKEKWVAIFDPIRAKQVEALDVTYATINKLKIPCEAYIKNLTPKCFAWTRKQEAVAKQMELELQAKARKEAEERAKAEAEQHIAAGRPDVAKSILEAPISVMPTVTVMPAKQAGAPTLRTKWKARITDAKLLLEAVCAGKAPLHILELNQAEADKLAAALKGEMRVPGLEAYEDPIYSKARSV